MAQIYYFSTTWCGPCKAFKPIVQQVAAEKQIPIQFVDAQQDPSLAAGYGISSVPTIVIAENGHIKYRHTGVLAKSELERVLMAHI